MGEITGQAIPLRLTTLKYSSDAKFNNAGFFCAAKIVLRDLVTLSLQNAYRSLPRIFLKLVPISSL